VSDAGKATEVSWLRANVMGPDQAVWALRITASVRHSDRCWGWGEPLGIAMECATDRPARHWSGVTKPDIVREGHNDTLVYRLRSRFLLSTRGSLSGTVRNLP
jgi:hypothetical protein